MHRREVRQSLREQAVEDHPWKVTDKAVAAENIKHFESCKTEPVGTSPSGASTGSGSTSNTEVANARPRGAVYPAAVWVIATLLVLASARFMRD